MVEVVPEGVLRSDGVVEVVPEGVLRSDGVVEVVPEGDGELRSDVTPAGGCDCGWLAVSPEAGIGDWDGDCVCVGVCVCDGDVVEDGLSEVPWAPA